MCRIIVILNKDNLKKDIIDEFISQSYKIKNTPGLNNIRDFNYHLDGYGLLFYDKDNKICTYKSPLDYKSDHISNSLNLVDKLIKSNNIFIGHIRATKFHFKDDICYNNTHPFWFDGNYMIHNGCIFPFDRNFFIKRISNKYHKHIKGTTDSEVLFYIYLTIRDNSNNAWKDFLVFLKNIDLENNIIISGNFVICSKNKIMISRFINNDEEPPSLYISNNDMIISSEPVTNNYKLIKKNTSIIYDINSKQKKIEDINKYVINK